MKVKTDTKERFTVIQPQETYLSANMTEEITIMLLPYLQKDIPHIVFDMTIVEDMEDGAGQILASLQQKFYESNCSFVICALHPIIEEKLDMQELLEFLNVTPTESEAWDIVQMEEMERELLEGED